LAKLRGLALVLADFFPSAQQPPRFQVIVSQRHKTAGSRRRSGCFRVPRDGIYTCTTYWD